MKYLEEKKLLNFTLFAILTLIAFSSCKKTKEGESVVNEAIVKVTLNSPKDGSTITPGPTGPNVQFSWSVEPSTGGTYKLRIVEITGDQTPAAAYASCCHTNKPIFEKDSIQALNIVYPSTAERLVPGKKYAWAITANKTSTTKLSESQASSFMIPK